IKAGETTSNFSINGVKIGTVNVQEKDGNGALRAAINAVKDQTGVEASVDAKGRLVLANRDGRGIKIEDNVKVPTGANDIHDLVTQGAAGRPNAKLGVDLGNDATWTTAAGNAGSILIKENTFGDVKNAHGVQDAAIYNDALTKTKQATAASNAYNTFHEKEQAALDKFKSEALKAMDGYISTAAATPATAAGQVAKAQGDAAAEKLKDLINNSKSFSEIATAIDTFNTAHSAAADAGTFKTAFTDVIAAATKAYATTVEDAGIKARGELAAYNQTGDVATLDGALDTMVQAATTGKTATTVANLKTLGDAMEAFETDGAPIGAKEVDFATLAAEKIGALNLTNNQPATGPAAGLGKEITDLFKDLRAQTTKSGANATIDKIEQKLDKLIDAANGKTMDTDEAKQGMIAHSFKQFFAGVKAGMNEPDKAGLTSIIGLNTENSTNMGRLSLVANNGRDIQVEIKDANGFTTNSAIGFDKNVSEATVSLRETNATINRAQADAMGFNNEEWQAGDNGDNQNGYAAGVMTLKGAQAMMNIAETAQKALEAIRSDLGSVQNQLVSTVNNISVTQVNVKAAESNIRDVDFAEESATFSKHQILAQSGVYAMSQANAVQQNVMRLLQ
ncbi:flagellin, partial [Campylobacter sp. Cr9]|uniref:flagellin n=1 Tax=Campylobacter sp. Cr9 TaxID=2735728 RepID=UPI0030151985